MRTDYIGNPVVRSQVEEIFLREIHMQDVLASIPEHLRDSFLRSSENLTKEQFAKNLIEFQDVFSKK